MNKNLGTQFIKTLGSGLDGAWSDNKEEFKTELINDIKTMLFGKWEKPWEPSMVTNKKGKRIPFSSIHGRPYTGRLTTILLQGTSKESPFFITLTELKKQKGAIKDIDMLTWAVGFVPMVKDVNSLRPFEIGDEKPDLMLPSATRIICTDWVQGVKVPFYKVTPFVEKELNQYIENVVNVMVKRNRLPKIFYDQQDSCYYSPMEDTIRMVKIMAFKQIDEYYSTLFHEIIHSTKATKRLGRGKPLKGEKGKAEYAAEELVAEMGAYILCAELGLNYNRKNSITYLKGWLDRAVKDSGKKQDEILVEAYGYAVDAVQYLLKDIDLEKLVPQTLTDRANESNEPKKVTKVTSGKKVTKLPKRVRAKRAKTEPKKTVKKVVAMPKKQVRVKREKLSDIDKTIEQLISNAEPFRMVELTDENYDKEFKDGISNTPIGNVTIDYKQIVKLETKERERFFGLIKPTLENPLLIVTSKDEHGYEREAFIKTFTDGKTVFFVSFVKTDKKLVVVSNHARRESQIKKILSSGNVVYKNNRITALSGVTDKPEPAYKTLIIGLNLESFSKDTKKTKQSQAKKSSKVEIVDFPIKQIHTDVKRFQNRQNEFSEESKQRIIKALENGTFDWAKFDPISLWKDPKDGKVYVLSGHSRFAAFKQKNKEGFIYDGYGFSTIPAKFFTGTEKQAIDFALNSNTLSTKETDVERAVFYAKMRCSCELSQLKGLGKNVDCAKMTETKCRENEGKNANFILNLSYLNPDGNLMRSLTMFGNEKDNDNTNVLRNIANWTGEARRTMETLTDNQEDEITSFLINGGYGNKSGQFKNKSTFLEYLRNAIQKWQAKGADKNSRLNLEQTIYKNSFERDHDKRLAEAKKEMDDAIAEYDEKYKKYLLAVLDREMTQERMDELLTPVVAWIRKTKENYNAIKGQKAAVINAATKQGTLFGIDDINKQFNKELTQLIQGNLPNNHVFYLGDMGDILIHLGIKILPIELQSNRLLKKSKQENHLFDLKLLKNLPEKINSPIMVFRSKKVNGSIVVLIELVSKGNNFVVAIELNKQVFEWKKGKINIHSIRSIYPKDTINDIVNWIQKEKLLLWVDKKKALDLLVRWRSNYANATLQIKGCINIVKNFANPDTNVQNQN